MAEFRAYILLQSLTDEPYQSARVVRDPKERIFARLSRVLFLTGRVVHLLSALFLCFLLKQNEQIILTFYRVI